MNLNDDSTLDATFSVPFQHRLHFTRDIFHGEQSVLADCLEPSGEQLPKVQFWLDRSLLDHGGTLRGDVQRFIKDHSARLQPAGIHVAEGGEAVKNDWLHTERCLQAIHDADLDRRSYIAVIGGGAVLDAVGFAAATAHRGIRLIRLPTTTLGQADSGVGVKNAVNRFGKKNWLGAFAVPWAVINDAALLATLPDRDFVAGFAEAVKVSLLKSATIFESLEQQATRIRARDPAATLPAIRASALLHRTHITRGGDPFEALEARPLDFGHWSAHRLETMTRFSLRHGEAVGIGVAIDTVYSSLVHGLDPRDATRVLRTLRALGLPLDHPQLHDTTALLDGLEEFRQHLGGRLTLTMLRGIADPIEVHAIDEDAMLEAIDRLRRAGRGDGDAVAERAPETMLT